MTTQAEQIAAAVVTALTVPAMASIAPGRVYRDLTQALGSEVLPAVAVELGNEGAPSRALIGKKDRDVQVRVSVVASGASPLAQCDAGVAESFARLFADPSLGGLAMDLIELDTVRSIEPGLEVDFGRVTKTYRVEYRTAENSL